ncbi:Undecaprenyl-phosphate mannosyltransferase [Anaerolineae bacterium]|nr:Undecaprenyl-phosphate mannosyltransferase [Anaerolineae bacterium]
MTDIKQFPKRASFYWAFNADQQARLRPMSNDRRLTDAVPYRVSVVIPTLNEAANLPHVLPFIPTWVDEVLLVDGASTDQTVEVARSLLPGIRIVQQEGRGKGAALRTCFAAATGDIIVMLDADGSTDPREIPAYVGTLLAGADYAKGSRFAQGGGTEDMTLLRRLGNSFFVMLVRALFGEQFTDLCYGYNAFWARFLPVLDPDTDGFEIETLLNLRALRANLNIREVPSFEYNRRHGESHLQTWPDGWRVLKTIIRERLRPKMSHGLLRPSAQHAMRAMSIIENRADRFPAASASDFDGATG